MIQFFSKKDGCILNIELHKIVENKTVKTKKLPKMLNVKSKKIDFLIL